MVVGLDYEQAPAINIHSHTRMITWSLITGSTGSESSMAGIDSIFSDGDSAGGVAQP